jgi:hypothetical protein
MSASCCGTQGSGGSGHRRAEDADTAFSFATCAAGCAKLYPDFFSACTLEVQALGLSVGADTLSSFYDKCVDAAGTGSGVSPRPPPAPYPPRTGCDCGATGRPADCCHGMTAECIACGECCSADEYCSQDSHFGSFICAVSCVVVRWLAGL